MEETKVMEEVVEEVKVEEQPQEEPKQEVQVARKNGLMQIDYLDGASLNKAYKNAKILSSSDLMPDAYKNRPENVLIAMDMANRSGFGLMTVLQNLYVVKGKPTWSGSFCVSAIRGCGRYRDVEYIFDGDGDDYGCYVKAVSVDSGKVVIGAKVNWRMVKDEGWLQKTGSKWKTMPEQMFRYRAAAFFTRTECPDILFGLQSAEEVYDVKGNEIDGQAKEVKTFTLEQ